MVISVRWDKEKVSRGNDLLEGIYAYIEYRIVDINKLRFWQEMYSFSNSGRLAMYSDSRRLLLVLFILSLQALNTNAGNSRSDVHAHKTTSLDRR